MRRVQCIEHLGAQGGKYNYAVVVHDDTVEAAQTVSKLIVAAECWRKVIANVREAVFDNLDESGHVVVAGGSEADIIPSDALDDVARGCLCTRGLVGAWGDGN